MSMLRLLIVEDSPKDASIVRRFLEEPANFGKKEYEKLIKFCWRLHRNQIDAEDLAQETIVRCLEKFPFYDAIPLPYAFVVARNLFNNQKRDSSRHPEISFSQWETEEQSNGHTLDKLFADFSQKQFKEKQAAEKQNELLEQFFEVVEKALNKLKPTDAQLLRMLLEGYSIEDIANNGAMVLELFGKSLSPEIAAEFLRPRLSLLKRKLRYRVNQIIGLSSHIDGDGDWDGDGGGAPSRGRNKRRKGTATELGVLLIGETSTGKERGQLRDRGVFDLEGFWDDDELWTLICDAYQERLKFSVRDDNAGIWNVRKGQTQRTKLAQADDVASVHHRDSQDDDDSNNPAAMATGGEDDSDEIHRDNVYQLASYRDRRRNENRVPIGIDLGTTYSVVEVPPIASDQVDSAERLVDVGSVFIPTFNTITPSIAYWKSLCDVEPSFAAISKEPEVEQPVIKETHDRSNPYLYLTVAIGGTGAEVLRLLAKNNQNLDPLPSLLLTDFASINHEQEEDAACSTPRLHYDTLDYWTDEGGMGIDGSGERHLCMLAGMGSGKTTLLTTILGLHEGNALVVDCDGQMYNALARHLGQRGNGIIGKGKTVLQLDPYRVARGKQFASWNPIEELDAAVARYGRDAAVDFAATLADTLIRKTEGVNEWVYSETRTFIKSLIIYVWLYARPENWNLVYLRRLITLGEREKARPADDPFYTLLADMEIRSDFDCLIATGATLMRRSIDKGDSKNPLLSTAIAQLAWLDFPRIAAISRRSDFHCEDLKTGNVCVFIVAPVTDIQTRLSGWVRALTFVPMHAYRNETAGHPKHPTLFALDEVPPLGHLEVVKTAAGGFRKYGIRLLTIVQNVERLREARPQSWSGFLGDSECTIWMANEHKETLEYLSGMLGITIHEEKVEGGLLSGLKPRIQKVERPLLYAHQLREFLGNNLVVTRCGKRPLRLKNAPYYKELPVHFYEAESNGRLYIPATSLSGILRSYIEQKKQSVAWADYPNVTQWGVSTGRHSQYNDEGTQISLRTLDKLDGKHACRYCYSDSWVLATIKGQNCTRKEQFGNTVVATPRQADIQVSSYTLTVSFCAATINFQLAESWKPSSGRQSTDWVGFYREDALDANYLNRFYTQGKLSMTMTGTSDKKTTMISNNRSTIIDSEFHSQPINKKERSVGSRAWNFHAAKESNPYFSSVQSEIITCSDRNIGRLIEWLGYDFLLESLQLEEEVFRFVFDTSPPSLGERQRLLHQVRAHFVECRRCQAINNQVLEEEEAINEDLVSIRDLVNQNHVCH